MCAPSSITLLAWLNARSAQLRSGTDFKISGPWLDGSLPDKRSGLFQVPPIPRRCRGSRSESCLATTFSHTTYRANHHVTILTAGAAQERAAPAARDPAAEKVMPTTPDTFRIGTLKAGVVVFVPVLVGGTCVQLGHRTFLLSHPKGVRNKNNGYYSCFWPSYTARGLPRAATLAIRSPPRHDERADRPVRAAISGLRDSAKAGDLATLWNGCYQLSVSKNSISS